MKVMVINSGSSSIKYKVFDMNEGSVLALGLLERIGEGTSSLTHSGRDTNGEMKETCQTGKVADHRQGLVRIVQILSQSGVVGDPSELAGIGHRVVHGGEDFKEPTLVNDDVVASIRRNIPLAPLHNPANLIAIEAALEYVPNIPQVAV